MDPVSLRRLSPNEVKALQFDPLDPKTVEIASTILHDVRQRGEAALLEHATRLGDIKAGEAHILTRDKELKAAFDAIPIHEQQVLERTANRIKLFAEAQKRCLTNLPHFQIEGGSAGHVVTAVERAGCYAPGGRYPLPSSVLMTAITARVAGVKEVWVASPRPAPITLAAAYVSGADALLAVGGAQAIAALTYGAGKVPSCDAVVGPGNKFVTAAKQLVAGRVAIDMLAGPSECLVIADSTANAAIVAADLIAQAEHDPDARPILISVGEDAEKFVASVDAEVNKQLKELPTDNAKTAALAFKDNGMAVCVSDINQAVELSDRFAPEHLELHVANVDDVKNKVKNYGAVFVGTGSAEVFGDYGAGPNHVLPTGGTARSNGGLSVFTFLKVRTFLQIHDMDASRAMMQDAYDLAKLEGLHGHANAAKHRLDLSASKFASTEVDRPLALKTPAIVRLALPKGHMEKNIFKLLDDAGIKLSMTSRGYRPTISIPGFEVKLLKPQNIVEMLNLGSRDIGFTGSDLIAELGATNVTNLLDTGMDKIKLVAAAPEALFKGDEFIGLETVRGTRKLRVATEYTHLTQQWMTKKGFNPENSLLVHSRGATEVFPPEDADIIVDNCATGNTLKANRLLIIDEMIQSTTCIYAHKGLVDAAQENDREAVAKKQAIDKFVTLLKSVLDAYQHAVLEFNAPASSLDEIVKALPAMRRPTIAPLHGDSKWFAVKSAVHKSVLFSLIPIIKEHGGVDIIAFDLKQVVH